MPKKLISVRIDEDLLHEVRWALAAKTNSDAIRLALERTRDLVKEEDKTQRFFKRWAGKGGPTAFESIVKERLQRRRR